MKCKCWSTICNILLRGRNFVSYICKRFFLRYQARCPSPSFFVLNLEISQCADEGVCRTTNAYDLAALLASGAGRLSAVFKFLFGEQSLLLFSLSSELSIILTFLNRQTISSQYTKQISHGIYLRSKRFFSIDVKVIIVERVITVEEIIQVKIPIRG